MNNIDRLYECLELLREDEPNVLFVTSNWLHFLQTEEIENSAITERLNSLGCYYSSKYETYYLNTEVLYDNRAK